METELKSERLYVSAWMILCGFLCTAWVYFFPISGDGDAVLHFENFREGQNNIKSILHPWARPLYAAINLPVSYLGLLPTRLFHLILGLLMAWQTYRYAKELRLSFAHLAIPLSLLQPFAYQLTGDTMTEIPYALLVIIILRLWHHQKYAWLCLLVGLTPLVRPEGFFLGLAMGLLFLFKKPTNLPLGKRWSTMLLGSIGMLLWLVAGKIWADDWLYVKNSWPWGDVLNYGSGSFFDYPKLLCVILGMAILPFWLIGTFYKPLEKKLIPNQFMWWLVFGVHTILWTGGWMGSAGLPRIIACVTPFAAITAVKGWGICFTYIAKKYNFRPFVKPLACVLLITISASIAIRTNLLMPRRHYGLITHDLAKDNKDQFLHAPAIVSSDPALLSLISIHPNDPRIKKNKWSKEEQHKLLSDLPSGSVILWDNQRGAQWHHTVCEEIEGLDYKIIDQHEFQVFAWWGSYDTLRGVIAVKQ